MDETNYGIRLAVGALVTWRLTHLLASEDGPADVIVRFRVLLGQSLAGKLMDCFNCLSLWIAAPVALFVTRKLSESLVLWLALSGAACLLERFGPEPVVMEPGPQILEGDTHHVLRSETSGVAEQHESPEGANRITSCQPPASSTSPGASYGATLEPPDGNCGTEPPHLSSGTNHA
jgi:hypothetical protein